MPDSEDGRRDWAGRVGVVAAHRELTRYEDQSEPLGQAPKPGQVEAYASWHAAWQALGRPTADRAEVEMSTGQLRVRIAAYETREDLGPDVRGRPACGDPANHGGTPERRHLLTAKADAAADQDQRDELLEQANEAIALAATLEGRAAELATADEARGQWYAHTAETRAAAERATAELASRDDAALDEQSVTAKEWLAARRASDEVEDPYREIADEHEIADVQEQRDQDLAASRREPSANEPVAEPAPDIRSEGDAQGTSPDSPMRVPSADETEAAVRRAQRALVELRQRQAAEDQHLADEPTEQDDDLARWHHDEQSDAQDHQRLQSSDEHDDAAGRSDAPALELSPIN